jgi:hypothetical protein
MEPNFLYFFVLLDPSHLQKTLIMRCIMWIDEVKNVTNKCWLSASFPKNPWFCLFIPYSSVSRPQFSLFACIFKTASHEKPELSLSQIPFYIYFLIVEESKLRRLTNVENFDLKVWNVQNSGNLKILLWFTLQWVSLFFLNIEFRLEMIIFESILTTFKVSFIFNFSLQGHSRKLAWA